MNNKSVSDFVAATMNAVLESAEHKALFGTVKTAQTITRHKDKDPSSTCDGVLARGECLKCHKTFDMSHADDNAAKDDSSASYSAEDCSMADDSSSKDSAAAEDSSMESSAFDVAIDSLLTASAALDAVGLEKTSAISLKIASFVVEAKAKKEKASSSSSKKKEQDSKKKKEEDSKKKKEEDSKKKKEEDSKKKKEQASSKGKSKK